MADSTILAETEAFITKQRDALMAQREAIFTQQQELQSELDEVNAMLAKFDVFEGKASSKPSSSRRAPAARKGSKRDEVLQIIKSGGGLSRGELLERMNLKGDKSGEMSVSNALTALTKSNQVRRDGGKYHVT